MLNNGNYRHQVTTKNGVSISRQFVYMPDELWAALRRLCVAQDRSGSMVIQSLVALADASMEKKSNADRFTRKQ
jgi:hypothetical protein